MKCPVIGGVSNRRGSDAGGGQSGGKSRQMAFRRSADLQNQALGWLQRGASSFGGGTVVRFPRTLMSSRECRLRKQETMFRRTPFLRRATNATGFIVALCVLAATSACVEPRGLLPENTVVIPPGPEVPKEISIYSGIWEGRLKGRNITVAVTRLTPETASVIYAWGEHAREPDPSGYLQGEGIVEDGKVILHWTKIVDGENFPGSVTLNWTNDPTYTYDSSGNKRVMIVTFFKTTKRAGLSPRISRHVGKFEKRTQP